MSSHGYRTTTVEYYEYVIPETQETLLWPFNTDDNFLVVPVEDNMAQYYQRPTIYEYRQLTAQQCNQSLPTVADREDQDRFKDDQTESREPSSSPSPSQSKCKRKQKHVYQAKEGYLVEEPTSESSEHDQ